MARNVRRRWLTGAGIAAFWLLIWQGLSLLVGQEILLPSPVDVVIAAIPLVGSLAFWQAVALTIIRIALGFLAALIVGTALAAATAAHDWIRKLTAPILNIVRAAPVASFIILAFVWIPVGRLPAFIAFLMVLPVIWTNVESGIRHTDGKLLEMAKVFRLSRRRTLWQIRIPSVMPYLLSACKTGLGFAWKSGVAAEVIARPPLSIGTNLFEAKAYLETPRVFVWTITVILLSVLFEKLLVALYAHWQKKLYFGTGGDGV